MNVEVKKEAGYWNVLVNGVLMVDRESYQVANNVAEAIKNGAQGNNECDEVARAILKYVGEAG